MRLSLSCRRKVKTNMAKMWQKVYDQNYHKSLDHRSFYFKQARFTHDLASREVTRFAVFVDSLVTYGCVLLSALHFFLPVCASTAF